MGERMDSAIVSATAGVLGSLVGASAAVATAWVTQKTQSKRELIQEEMRRRETLYGEFVAECAKLLIDAFTHTALRLPAGSHGGRTLADANRGAILLAQPDARGNARTHPFARRRSAQVV